MTDAALKGGLEWTVKLTQRGQAALLGRAEAHFETLCADSEFQRYDPDDAAHGQALAATRGREAFSGKGPATPIAFSTCSSRPTSRTCWSNWLPSAPTAGSAAC